MDAVEILSVITTDAAQRLTLTEMDDAIAEAIQALESMPEYKRLKERDRAKKPRQSGVTDSNGIFHPTNGIDGVPYDLCPNCDHVLRKNREYLRFCEYCGQRIDWTEQEEEQ